VCAYAFYGSSDYSRNRKCITTIKTGATVIYTISFTAIIALLAFAVLKKRGRIEK